MTKLGARDVKRFDKRLRERREALRQAIHDALAQTNRHDFTELAGRVHDAGEASVAELLASMNLAMLDREASELRDVEAAIGRLADGSYGRCEACGGEIDRERLEAYPTATRCIECERRREVSRTGGRDQTPSL